MILPACVWSKPRGPMGAKRIACTPPPVGLVAREPSAGSPCEVPHRGGGDGWFGLQPVVQLLWLPKPPSAVPEFSESPPATSTRPAAMLRGCAG